MFALFAAFAFCDKRPALTWQRCTKAGCTPVSGSVVSDTDARTPVDADIDDYLAQCGVSSTGGTLVQRLVTTYKGEKVIGSRLYLMAADGAGYELFNFNGKEIAYDVDVSQLTCPVNGALYTVEMPKNGEAKFGGAAKGSGYCDANYVRSKGSSLPGCAEFDIQEANQYAMVFTDHPCAQLGQFSNQVLCNQDGCGFNAYRYGAKTFWGGTINVKSKITVVTQFIGAGGLSEVRRLYVQGGRVTKNPTVSVYGNGNYDSLTAAFCKQAGHQIDGWKGLGQMGASFAKGHVLVFSLWDSDGMQWLDSGEYGPCTSMNKAAAEAIPGMSVTWSNIKFGDIDSTY
jgi:hypothetical protein